MDTEYPARSFAVQGNDTSGYIGVDPEYMTYADETHKPLLTDQERYDLTDQYDHLEGNLDDSSVDEENCEDDKESDDSDEAVVSDNGTENTPVVAETTETTKSDDNDVSLFL